MQRPAAQDAVKNEIMGYKEEKHSQKDEHSTCQA